MSVITDIVFVIPTDRDGHAKRFADIFEQYPTGRRGTITFRPEPIGSDGTKVSSRVVFHLAANRVAYECLEAIKAESWPRGTVLTYQTDEFDYYPTVVVWGEDGPIEHAWPICQRCGYPERKGEGPHDCLKAMGAAKC